ncbi:MAG: glutathione S-transferase [Sphingomonadaceae bacterium]
MKVRYPACLTELPILYSFRRCPYAMRARMALTAAQIEVEHREVALRNKPAALIAASPKATVPVLVLRDGRVIDESLYIMHWALAQHDPLGWGASDDSLIATYDGAFKFHLDRMKYPHRYEGVDAQAHYSAGITLLTPLEALLSNSGYLFGDAPRFTDIAIFPFIRQFARTDMAAWRQDAPPRVQRWLDQLIEGDLFDAAMVKHRLWTVPDDTSKEPI